jgi:hypothetical protein
MVVFQLISDIRSGGPLNKKRGCLGVPERTQFFEIFGDLEGGGLSLSTRTP